MFWHFVSSKSLPRFNPFAMMLFLAAFWFELYSMQTSTPSKDPSVTAFGESAFIVTLILGKLGENTSFLALLLPALDPKHSCSSPDLNWLSRYSREVLMRATVKIIDQHSLTVVVSSLTISVYPTPTPSKRNTINQAPILTAGTNTVLHLPLF